MLLGQMFVHPHPNSRLKPDTRNLSDHSPLDTRHCFVRRHSLLVVHYWTKVQYTSTTFRSIVRSNFLNHVSATAMEG